MKDGDADDKRLEAYWSALVADSSPDALQLREPGRAEFAILDELNDVRLLLQHDSTLGNASVATEREFSPSFAGLELGQQIDGYAIDELLGRGGMGVVYSARQVALDRAVALKFIRTGPLATEEDHARFRSEASATARLSHPGIVSVYDFGRWEGFDYISMERVLGPTLSEVLQAGPMSPDQACRYARQLCAAIGHAHENDILHRDIKPSNILIESDTDQVRVMDFGLAKSLASDDEQTPALTLSGAMIGTPSYMSPEQALGLSGQVGIHSDVYSIGAVLYEMLTGRPPFQAASPMETMRQVVDADPASVRSLNPEISRDLETICLKCLAKLPPQRYESPRAVAEDLQRVVEGRPILARRVSAVRRAWKWCSRNTALATSLALLILSLLVGTITSTIMWRASALNAKRAEQRLVAEQAAKAEAEQQAENARAVTQFFTVDVLRRADPHSSPDRDVRLADVLAAANQQLGDQFADKPLIAAAVHQALGDTYLGLGKTEVCEGHLRKAAELHRQELGDEHPQTIESLARIGMFYYSAGRYAEAEEQYRQIIAITERTLGPEHHDTLHKRGQLAHAIYWQGRLEEAEAIYLDVIEKERPLGEDHFPALLTMNNLAILYCSTNRFDQAKTLLVETLRRQRNLLGDENPHTLTTLNNLGYVYCGLGDFAKAKPYCEQAVALRERVLGDHSDTAYAIHNLGLFHWMQQQHEDALPYFQRAYRMRQKVLGNDHPDTQLSIRQLGKSHLALGQYDEALPFCEEAWQYAETHTVPDSRKYFLMSLYGSALAQQRDLADNQRERAKQMLQQAWEGLRRLQDEETHGAPWESDLRFSGEQLIAAYQAWGDTEQADDWQERVDTLSAEEAAGG